MNPTSTDRDTAQAARELERYFRREADALEIPELRKRFARLGFEPKLLDDAILAGQSVQQLSEAIARAEARVAWHGLGSKQPKRARLEMTRETVELVADYPLDA